MNAAIADSRNPPSNGSRVAAVAVVAGVETATEAVQQALLDAFIAVTTTPSPPPADEATAQMTSVTQWCHKANVAPADFYRWLSDPDFAEWWAVQTEAVIRAEAPGVFRALTHKALAGDLGAIKTWLQRFDRLDASQAHDIDAYRRLLERFVHRAIVPPDAAAAADALTGTSVTAPITQ